MIISTWIYYITYFRNAYYDCNQYEPVRLRFEQKQFVVNLLQSLFHEEYKQFKESGGNKMIKGLRKLKLPVNIAGVSATITNYVGAYDMPLLLTKEAMKKANTKMDFKQN